MINIFFVGSPAVADALAVNNKPVVGDAHGVTFIHGLALVHNIAGMAMLLQNFFSSWTYFCCPSFCPYLITHSVAGFSIVVAA
jgi:hypothetical protein